MGERNLDILIRNMTPELRGNYVFCTVDEATFSALPLKPLGFFAEREGITLIVSQEDADRCRLHYTCVASLISLGIHSDLEAVGFLATICTALADAGISTNVISGYYHDHLFIPHEAAERALSLLAKLSNEH